MFDERSRNAKPQSKRPPVSRRRRAAHRTLAVLPTLCTLGNCLCGFLVIFFASRLAETKMLWDWTPLKVAASFVFVGMVFDALDGRLARLTRHTSHLGVQLDSMADMVTFGVSPAYLAVQLVEIETPFLSIRNDTTFDRVALVIACIYVACAALRLARFNIEHEDDQPDDQPGAQFEGLPTPAAAGMVASLVLLHQILASDEQWMKTSASLGMVTLMFLVALAMVSRLRYVHVFNRYLREKARAEYIAILVAVGLVMFIDLSATLAVAFMLYALSAPTGWVIAKLPRGWKKMNRSSSGTA